MIEAIKVKELYSAFLDEYDADQMNGIWQKQSQFVQRFLRERIWSPEGEPLNDLEIDDVVRILDRNGRGNRKGSEAVAKVMTPQGAWRRMFNDLKNTPSLSSALKMILTGERDEDRIKGIDLLYKENAKNKNNLTGKSGAVVGAFLAAYNPFEFSSMISLKDRTTFFQAFGVSMPKGLEQASLGQLIIQTNRLWIETLKQIGLDGNARTLSMFCYSPQMKALWKDNQTTTDVSAPESDNEEVDADGDISEMPEVDKNLFYLESQLEDFLIKNWEKTDLGKKYDLINDSEGLVSQQYKTDIGIIDILVKDKQDGRFVVIELKRNQTSDATIGQLTRYMGWVEEHLAEGKSTKGIIIAAEYDPRIYYAVKMVPDVEVYEYRVEFFLEPYKKK